MNELKKLNNKSDEDKRKLKIEKQVEFAKLVNESGKTNKEIAYILGVTPQKVSTVKNNINFTVSIKALQIYIDKLK